MQVKIDKKQFVKAVKNCSVRKKLTPKVMLTAKEGKLTVYATDLYVYTVFTIPAEVKEDGIVSVDHKKLLNMLKTIKDKEITIRTENDYLFINSAKIKIDFKPVYFPQPEAFPPESISISGTELLRGINKTLYAVSGDSSGFAINDVCFSFIDNKLDFVATDGYRLALYTTYISEKKYEGKYIITKKVFKVLKNLVKQKTNVEFAISNKFAFFKIDDTIIQAILIEGVYPEYYRFIPNTFNIELKLDRYLFTELLQEVISLIDGKVKPIVLTLSNNRLTVANVANEDVAIERFYDLNETYQEFKIGFNGQYLFEAINCIEDRNVIVKFIDKDSPVVITPENPEERYLAVVMPRII